MALSCIISETKRDIGRKSRFFSYPPCIRRPRYGGLRRNNAILFGVEKLEWYGYPTVKTFEDMFSRFDRIPACAIKTDRQTDRQTYCNGIVRAMHSIAR